MIYATTRELDTAHARGVAARILLQPRALSTGLIDLLGHPPVGETRTLELMTAFYAGYDDAAEREARLIETPRVEKTDARLTTVCPVCQAKPGQLCTQPTETTRTAVSWMHTDRGFHDLINGAR